MTKKWKTFTPEKFFGVKLKIYLSQASIKDVKATGDAFSPQKENGASKHEFSLHFPPIASHFCPPKINAVPDPQHWIKHRANTTTVPGS
jgi:hypothetical protein